MKLFAEAFPDGLIAKQLVSQLGRWVHILQVMQRASSQLRVWFANSAKLEQSIKANLRGLGYGG